VQTQCLPSYQLASSLLHQHQQVVRSLQYFSGLAVHLHRHQFMLALVKLTALQILLRSGRNYWFLYFINNLLTEKCWKSKVQNLARFPTHPQLHTTHHFMDDSQHSSNFTERRVIWTDMKQKQNLPPLCSVNLKYQISLQPICWFLRWKQQQRKWATYHFHIPPLCSFCVNMLHRPEKFHYS